MAKPSEPAAFDAAITEHPSGCTLDIVVVPRASRTALVGVHDRALKIALAAPPVDGAANAALVEFVARACGVPKRAVTLAHGTTSKRKRVHLAGVDAPTLRATLATLLAE